MFACEKFTRSACTGLYFVEYQNNTMLISHTSQMFQKFFGNGNKSGFTLDRFYNCCYGRWIDLRNHLVIELLNRMVNVFFLCKLFRSPVQIRSRQTIDVGYKRTKSFFKQPFACE